MEEITYKLEKFEGPLDLLLNLIHKNKVQIEDMRIIAVGLIAFLIMLFGREYTQVA